MINGINSLYNQGQFFHATKPVDKAEWEDAGRPIPLLDDLLFTGDATNQSITAVNLTGQELVVGIDGTEAISPKYGNKRWNEKEYTAVPLGRGQSVLFPVAPECFIFSVNNYRLSEYGRTFEESDTGISLQQITNTTLTLSPGVYQGTVKIAYTNSVQDNMTTVKNNTKELVCVYISQIVGDDQSSNRPPQKIDTGPKIVQRQRIEPGGCWNIRLPVPCYNVRAMQPNEPNINNTSKAKSLAILEVPNTSDYVELACVAAQQGYVVVFFAKADGNGAVEGTSLPLSQCIRVSDRLVTRIRARV